METSSAHGSDDDEEADEYPDEADSDEDLSDGQKHLHEEVTKYLSYFLIFESMC